MSDKILVVDDEPDILELAMTILNEQGYQVVGAHDGESAIQKVEVETPDLILMDVVMPGKSGVEVCRLLKNKPKTKYVPIVLFSALGRDVDIRMAQEVGAAHLFTKPFTEESLTKEVKEYLQEARLDKFSKQLGTGHKELLERKILIEYETSAHYERLVRDFAYECISHSEKAMVLTRIGNPVYNAVEGDRSIERVTEGMPTPMLSRLLNREKEHLGLVFDNITDLVVARGMQASYQYLQNALGFLATKPTTAIFLLNPSAHEQTVSHTLRGLFGNRAVYGKEGLVTVNLS